MSIAVDINVSFCTDYTKRAKISSLNFVLGTLHMEGQEIYMPGNLKWG